MIRHLLIVPSLTCQAHCSYCFGPHKGSALMDRVTVKSIVRWQKTLNKTNKLEITFHGGEPLIAGESFYRMALPLLREGLTPQRIKFALQSNLWLLTDELCEIFREYGVSLGTSLDGPEAINDVQRGKGYYQRTMAGIERARSHGLDVGCICTFTARSALYADDIFNFFVSEGLNFSVHAASPSMRYNVSDTWSLTTDNYGTLMVDLLEYYLKEIDKIRISTLDSMCRSVSAGRGGICTFSDCLGGYLAVGPDGDIYICQRFAGMKDYQVGSVHTEPSTKAFSASPAWRAFKKRQDRIQDECGECEHVNYCRGGCPYNALAANRCSTCPNDAFDQKLRDPHCPAYRLFFSHITDRAMEEVFSKENLEAVVNHPTHQGGLLRRGKLLAIIRDGPHPYQKAANAR